MRPYRALFTMSIREALVQKSAIMGSVLMWCMHVVLIIGVYSVVFHAHGGTLRGMDFLATVWSIRIYFIALATNVRYIAKEIARDVLYGSIETKLTKPFNYLFAMGAAQLGRGVPYVVVSAAVNILFPLFIIGLPHISFSFFWCARALALFVGGTVLGLLFYGIIGLCAVWLQDVDPLYWVMDKSVMLLGGAYIPVALFPSSIRSIGEHTPFGAVMFISQIFNPDFSTRWTGLFLTQMTWVGMLTVTAWFVYGRAMKHVSVNGG